MLGLDHAIAGLGGGGATALALLVAVLLGLRHATDPDHLTAVASLVVSDEESGSRRAGALGIAWGLGHATTLFLFGLPVVLFRSALPEPVLRAAEIAIGVVIAALAIRLLVRWRRGYLHLHPHSHGAVEHAHPHVHEAPPESVAGHHEHEHEHRHAETLGRSPMTAFSIGLVHGVGGSAGVGILLVGAISGRVAGAAALALFAAAAALSMGLVSAGFAHALARGPLARRLETAVPIFGMASLLFGCWYALGAMQAVPYGL
jgi:ABC-type nickel/cobalt efflux system permease component RcnA